MDLVEAESHEELTVFSTNYQLADVYGLSFHFRAGATSELVEVAGNAGIFKLR